MDYKNTLNLPDGQFPMKADLPNKEPKILENWLGQGLYEQISKARANAPVFVLHDGPPYANGDIHIGHALNKILKDIIVKYKTMRGYRSPYVPGWDCHGLPVEHQLFKELKITKHEIDALAFRKKAHDYAMNFVDKQRQQFQRLGVFGDWNKPYLTLDPTFEAGVIEALTELVKKGYVYQSPKPVHWCWHCETALAEAELEYNEAHKSPSITVLFPIDVAQFAKTNISLPSDQPVSFAVWTTTPWTLTANVAVALHPQMEYQFVRTPSHGIVIVLADLVQRFLEKLPEQDRNACTVLGGMSGSSFEGLSARHPYEDRVSRVVSADYVSATDGTGCVHTAPGHGMDDYKTGLKWKLPTLMFVDEKGKIKKEAGQFAGQFIFKANDKIIEALAGLSRLIASESITHSYPYCWRCKNPVITRSTAQWFVAVDHRNLRTTLLENIDKASWYPAMGKNRISSMIQNRPDWCISRQRYWGIPIPSVHCQDCDKGFLSVELLQKVRTLFEKEGSDAWFAHSLQDIFGADLRCPNCQGQQLKKGEDILDVWFESGASHVPVLIHDQRNHFPADLYLEGSDQHRGWFQSSLLVSCGMSERAPFGSVLTHGFIVDAQGHKMSKSTGNVISPADVMKQYGADILRLWVVSSDTSDDIKISTDNLARIADGYRKIRNTFKYLLGNTQNVKGSDHRLDYNKMLEVDRWILSRLEYLKQETTRAYEAYELHRIYQLIYQFCVVDLSSFYLDVLKDRLYADPLASDSGKSARCALQEILSVLTRILAPVLAFTTEEVWSFGVGEQSIHLQNWPEANMSRRDLALEKKMTRFLEIRQDVLKSLEIERTKKAIGNSLEAEVELAACSKEDIKLLESFGKDLAGMLLVSGALVVARASAASEGMTLDIKVIKSAHKKCSRCWNYRPDVGINQEHEEICARCADAVTGKV